MTETKEYAPYAKVLYGGDDKRAELIVFDMKHMVETLGEEAALNKDGVGLYLYSGDNGKAMIDAKLVPETFLGVRIPAYERRVVKVVAKMLELAAAEEIR